MKDTIGGRLSKVFTDIGLSLNPVSNSVDLSNHKKYKYKRNEDLIEKSWQDVGDELRNIRENKKGKGV